MKSPHQTIAPYLILQYLLKMTDEKTNVIRRADISSYLSEDCGVQLAEHAVGNAISELNIALRLIEENETADDAAAYLDENPDEAHILYDKKRQGFFVNRRPHDIGADDIRLIAESVYSAKFIEESETRHLVDELCALVSDNQAAAIKHEVPLIDRRRKTSNHEVFNSVAIINEAMSARPPLKISFTYLGANIKNLNKPTSRRKGDKYIADPYHLLIKDGNYYLLCYDAKTKANIRTYRIDRMKNVEVLPDQPREGSAAMRNINFNEYAASTFNMYGGEEVAVILRFIPPLLDTMTDKFGRGKHVEYFAEDERHYKVRVKVQISDQFFGWVLGFGKRVKIIAPDDVVVKFKEYLDKVRSIYGE